MAAGSLAFGQSKFDGRAQRLVGEYNERIEAARSGASLRPRMQAADLNESEEYFVTLAPGYTADDVTDAGFDVTLAEGQILLVRVSVAQLEELASLDAVRHISAPRKMRTMLDRGRAAISADAVLDGTSSMLNNMKFSGKGVVTGIVDMGIDPNHINFIDENGKHRVKEFYTWYNYGESSQTAYKGEDAVASATTGTPNYDHGTHVLGIIGGSYHGPTAYNYMSRDISITNRYTDDEPNANPYYGLAQDAEIVASDIELFNSRIAHGVKNAVDYAKSVNKPCVVNLSLGGMYGPRDATSELNLLLSEYVDDAILVVASGNDGDSKLAVRGEFDDNTKQIRTIVAPTSGKDVVYEGEFWSSDNTVFTFKPCIVDMTTGQVIDEFVFDKNTMGEDVFYNGTQYQNNIAYNPSEAISNAFNNRAYVVMHSNIDTNNNRYNVQVQTSLRRNGKSDDNLMFGYIIEAPAGVKVYGYIDSYNEAGNTLAAQFSDMGLEGWTDGTEDGSLSDMACADGTIVVGSYTTRLRWASLAGKGETYGGLNDVKGQVSSFSGYGRLVDGRVMPHVVAPGAVVISSTNKYYVDRNYAGNTNQLAARTVGQSRDNFFAGYGGTSMATPFVTGTVALMLEAYPEMTVAEAREILVNTASKDKVVGLDRDDIARCGAGLINVEKAVAGAIAKKSGDGVEGVLNDADNNFALTSDGRLYTAIVGGASSLNATLYSIAGSAVAYVAADGDSITVDASGLPAGVYILRVSSANATYARRILVK